MSAGATHPKPADGRVVCPECQRYVGTFSNGKIRPHYGANSAGLCRGAYTMSRSPSA